MPTVADAATLAASYADRLLVGTTRDVHAAIARRVFGLPGTRHPPAGLVHDRISGAVYGCISAATRSAAYADKVGLGRSDLEKSAKGRRSRSVANGLIGDVLRQQDDPVAIWPSVRVHARDVELGAEAVAAAFPQASGRLAFFLHGLCEDDECWNYKAATRGPSYLARLGQEPGRWLPAPSAAAPTGRRRSTTSCCWAVHMAAPSWNASSRRRFRTCCGCLK